MWAWLAVLVLDILVLMWAGAVRYAGLDFVAVIGQMCIACALLAVRAPLPDLLCWELIVFSPCPCLRLSMLFAFMAGQLSACPALVTHCRHQAAAFIWLVHPAAAGRFTRALPKQCRFRPRRLMHASQGCMLSVNQPITGMWRPRVRLCLPFVGSGQRCQVEDASCKLGLIQHQADFKSYTSSNMLTVVFSCALWCCHCNFARLLT